MCVTAGYCLLSDELKHRAQSGSAQEQMRTGLWWLPGHARLPTAVQCDNIKQRLKWEGTVTPEMQSIAAAVDFKGTLKKSSIMQDMPSAILDKLVDEAGHKAFAKKGAVLIESGTLNECMFVIGAGVVDIQIERDTRATLQSGSIVGEQSLVNKRPANADVVAGSDFVYVLVLRHEDVIECLKDKPEILGRMTILAHERQKVNRDISSKKHYAMTAGI